MTTFERRLDRVETQFSPKQTFIAWMTETYRRFNSNSEYQVWRAEHPDAPDPVNDLLLQTEAAVRNQKKGASKEEIRKAIYNALKDVGFLLMLLINVNEYVGVELRVIKLRAVLLFQLIRVASERESALEEAPQLVGHFARAPYPLCASDAASVLTTVRNRVLTYSHLECGRVGLFGAQTVSPTDLDQQNPLVEWVRAHYAREGRPVLPQVVYEARERGALSQDRSHANLIFGLDRGKVRNLFPDSKAYGDFVSGRDFSYRLADVRDEEFHRVVDSVVRSLRELVASGEIQAAKQIFLPSSPFPFLRQVPVIDNEWVDLYAIELAEFGCRLLQEGFEICESPDPHPLAPCALSPEENDEGKDPEALRDKVAANLSKFPGRVISIEGRPFLNLADYLAWPDARAAGELKIEDGFSVASFNAWVESQATEDVKLAGIDLSPVFFSVCESSFVTCSSSDEAVDTQFEREHVIEMLRRRGVDQGWLNFDLDLLWDTSRSHALAVLTINAVVKYIEEKFFESQPLLFKSDADQIAAFKHGLPSSASLCEHFLLRGSWHAKLSQGQLRRARRRRSHFDLNGIEKSIDPEQEARRLIDQARAEVALVSPAAPSTQQTLTLTEIERLLRQGM